MRKKLLILFSSFLALAALAGCAKAGSGTAATAANPVYVDGVYYAEFANFDSRGYKDTLQITVEGGCVTAVVYDAVNEAGGKKNEDTEYGRKMEEAQNTTPSRYSSDLINQYLEYQTSQQVVAVAGATYSSQSFKALLEALEPRMKTGDTTPIAVENVPEL